MNPTADDVYKHYDALSRRRALTESESRALERAIKEIDKRDHLIRSDEWSAEDDATLARLYRAGHSFAMIGKRIGRTKSACYSRFRRIGRPDVADKVEAICQARQEKYQVVTERNAKIMAGKLRANDNYVERLARASRG